MRTTTSSILFISAAIDLLTSVDALVLPVRRSSGIVSRQSANATNAVTMVNFGAGINYLVPITIGGQTFDVVLDTGSADLWVETATPLSGSFDSTQSTTISYGSGATKGEDKFGTVSFGGFTIENQLYMEVTPENYPSSFLGIPGILGVAPNSVSQLSAAAGGDPRANNTLSNLFTQNNQTEPFFTIQLGRPSEIISPTPGTFTLGEALSDLTNVTSQPQLPIASIAAKPGFFQWAVSLDGMSVNGQAVSLPSSVANPTGNFTVVLDSGTSGATVPQTLFDAIYGGLNSTGKRGSVPLFPCDSEVNVTFKFGGQEYPVHQLDFLTTGLGLADLLAGDDSPLPAGTCAPQYVPVASNAQTDAILGDAFLRSVYMLNHFGDSIRGGSAQPYIQLLSTVDVASAHEQFVQVRVDGVGLGTKATDGPAVVTASVAIPLAGATASSVVSSTAAAPAVTATDSSAAGAVTASSESAVATGSSTDASVTDASTSADATASVDTDPSDATTNASSTDSDTATPTPGGDARRSWRSRR